MFFISEGEGVFVRMARLLHVFVLVIALGYFTYDPGFTATASCTSSITFIDGGKGILRYRGYPIEQLAENSDFLEVAYLLLEGELPTHLNSAKLVLST